MKKKNKFSEFFNSKGFYSALFTCLFAVLAIAAFVSIKNIDAITKLSTYGEADAQEEAQPAGVQMDKTVPELISQNESQGTAKTGPESQNAGKSKEMDNEKKVEPKTPVKTQEKELPKQQDDKPPQDSADAAEAQSEQVKVERKDEKPETKEEAKESAEETKTDTKPEQDSKANAQTDVKSENAESEKPKEENSGSRNDSGREAAEVPEAQAHFEDGDKMSWPLDGAIVMDYSLTRAIYDKTLEQYRTNPSISIASDVGTQVKASANGTVKSIMIDPRTGYTVTIDHGNGWQTSYGQLQETILVKEGETVTKGQAIGGVGTPTKYGVMLGSHLVFGISKDDTPQNPKVVLAEKND